MYQKLRPNYFVKRKACMTAHRVAMETNSHYYFWTQLGSQCHLLGFPVIFLPHYNYIDRATGLLKF